MSARSGSGSGVCVLSGVVQPATRTLEALVPVTIARVLVEEGQHVASGQPLLELDPGQLAIQVAIAAAEVATSQSVVRESHPAAEWGGDSSRGEPERRHAEARAGYRDAMQALWSSVVRAPRGGRVAAVRVRTGERVGKGHTLVTLALPGSWRVVVRPTEGLPRSGWTSASIRFDHGERCCAVLDPAGPRDGTLTLAFDAPRAVELTAGMGVQVELDLDLEPPGAPEQGSGAGHASG